MQSLLVYRKEIEITHTGMVVAKVWAPGGELCGMEFFAPFFRNNRAVERIAKKAHAWADERIRICREVDTRQEVQ